MRRTAVVAASMVVLTGCGAVPLSEPSPSVTTAASPAAPSATAPATPSSPISTPPPAMPAAAAADTKAGAIAFVEYYVQLLGHLETTGDAGPLLAHSLFACTPCKASVGSAKEIYSSGASVEGGGWTIEAARAKRTAGGSWDVTISGLIAPATVVRAGATLRTSAGGQADVEFVLRYGKTWKVAQWHAA